MAFPPGEAAELGNMLQAALKLGKILSACALTPGPQRGVKNDQNLEHMAQEALLGTYGALWGPGRLIMLIGAPLAQDPANPQQARPSMVGGLPLFQEFLKRGAMPTQLEHTTGRE